MAELIYVGKCIYHRGAKLPRQLQKETERQREIERVGRGKGERERSDSAPVSIIVPQTSSTTSVRIELPRNRNANYPGKGGRRGGGRSAPRSLSAIGISRTRDTYILSL